MTRTYGYDYDRQRGLTTAQIAALIRSEIKQSVSEGLLPRWRYSVRTRTFAGGSAIDITVTAPEAFAEVGPCQEFSYCGYGSHDRDCAASPYRLSGDGEAAKMTLERIHGAWNHDGSDISTDYFDVNYYGGVTFQREARS